MKLKTLFGGALSSVRWERVCLFASVIGLVILGCALLLSDLRLKRTMRMLETNREAAINDVAASRGITAYRQEATTDEQHVEKVAGTVGVARGTVPAEIAPVVESVAATVTAQTVSETGREPASPAGTHTITLGNGDFGSRVWATIRKDDGEVLWQRWQFDERFSLYYERTQHGKDGTLDVRLVRNSSEDPKKIVWERQMEVQDYMISAPPSARPDYKWLWYVDAGVTPSNGGSYYLLGGVQRDLFKGLSLGTSVYADNTTTSLGVYLAYSSRF